MKRTISVRETLRRSSQRQKKAATSAELEDTCRTESMIGCAVVSKTEVCELFQS